MGRRTLNVSFNIFKSERQLVGIPAFGATPKLTSLKLGDDGTKPLDFIVAVLDNTRNLTHQTVQQTCIRRQIAEIDLHMSS